ncbi:MAG: NAD(P)/FAD-dependent oxidoreductase [Dehalococcoidia bacterium]
MPNRYDCDVAVVGAGPAGSRTARNIAARGYRVKLLEEHRRIGVPSHCSGLISRRTLAEAEIGEEAVLHKITGAYIHGAGGTEVALGGERDRAVVIDRVRWDETLCQQAQAAGAELVQARLLHAEREDGGMRLQVLSEGRPHTLRARLLVGADGAHSRVARSLGLAGPGEKVYCLGIEGRLRLPREEFVHVFVGRALAPGWFGWIIPIGGDQVRVGIGSQGGEKPINCYRRLSDSFPHLFQAIEPCRFYGGTIPLEFVPRSYGENVLLVGDAAGQVKPFSGGGIYTGLVAARHAAATAIAALDADDLSAPSLARYEKAWKGEIGRELTRSLRIRHFGLGLTDGELERVLGVLRAEDMRALAARYGDIDYPSRVILRLCRSLPALGLLASLSWRRPRAAWSLLRAYLPLGG